MHASGPARRRLVTAGLSMMAAIGAAPTATAAQGGTPPDSVRPQPLATIVVAADRTPAPMASAAASVSVLGPLELHVRPARTLADALQQAPGVMFVDFDGLGHDPQIMTRGFYGGGEAEYVVLLVDGRPVSAPETGRINWELIPLSAIESVELIRGGASAAWGDAAIGGVLNVVTRRDATRAGRATVVAGQEGIFSATASMYDRFRGRPVSVFGHVDQSDGFRAHSERLTGGVGASVDLLGGGDRSLGISTLNDWRTFDEPGPLSDAEVAADRAQSSPFYRFDETDESLHRLGVEGRTRLGTAWRLSGHLTGEYRNADRVRTLALAPDFADTKRRDLTSSRGLGSIQLELPDAGLIGAGLLAGVDASFGRLGSEYQDVFQGTQGDYAAGMPGAPGAGVHGVSTRSAAAAFARYAFPLTSSGVVSVGGRVDWLADDFEERRTADPASEAATHVAFSPKLGVNWRYAGSGANEGRVYASVSRSFKAPTPDQLFDQRAVPVPFPPFEITFANSDLNPQYALSYETGIYHGGLFGDGPIGADLTLSLYQIDLKDELDFDVGTLRYQNIGRSRHRGAEAGIRVDGPTMLGGFVSYTYQAATARSGDDSGRELKAIPRHFISGGIDLGHEHGPRAAFTITSAHRMWLDDANTRRIPDWTRIDARLSHALLGARIDLDVINLADREYSTTGFPDPAGSGAAYYYPAAGRTFRVGITRDW